MRSRLLSSALVVPALAAGLALTVVASPATSGATSSPRASGPPLVIDNVFNNEGLDPAHELAVTSNMVFRGTYDTLLTYKGNNFTPRPDLATSYKQSDGDRTWTFFLRHGVRFSNGAAVTSADVAFSFNRFINLRGPDTYLMAGISVSTHGPDEVLLHSATPNPAIPALVTTPTLAVLNEAVVKAHGGTDAADAYKTDTAQAWLNTHSAGSGPYVIAAVQPHEQYTLTTNPLYWGRKPHFGTVVIRNVLAQDQFFSIQRDSDEIAYDIPNSQAPLLKHKSALHVITAPSENEFYMSFSLKHSKSPVTSNLDIQRAIRLGLNYHSLVQLGGPGAVQLPGMIQLGILGALPPSAELHENLAKARALVKASGIKHPSFTMQYVNGGFSIFGVSLELVAEKVQASLAQVGINAVPLGLPIVQVINNTDTGNQQASVDLSTIDYPDPNDFLIDCPGGARGAPLGYTTKYAPQVAALCQKAATTKSNSGRAALWKRIEKSMNQNSPWIPEFQPDDVLVASSNLTGTVENSIWGVDVAAVGSH